MNKPISEFKTRFNKAISMQNIKPIDLANKTGLSKSTISHYMSGYTKPKSDKLYILAHALNVNPTWLMGFDVPIERNSQAVSGEITLYNVHCETRNEADLILTHRKLTDLSKKKVESYISTLFDLEVAETELNAAHDKGATEEEKINADSIMMNDDEWM